MAEFLLDVVVDRGANLGREEAENFAACKLDEYVRVGVTVKRRVCWWSAKPQGRGVDVTFDSAGGRTGDESRTGNVVSDGLGERGQVALSQVD